MTLARSIKLGKKQEPPAYLAVFESSMGSAGLSQRISASNLDGEFSFLDPGHESLKVMRIFLEVRQSVGASHKQRSFFLQGHQVKGWHISAGLSVNHEVSGRSQAIEADRECIFADAVVDDAHASAFSDPSGFLRDVGLRGHDDGVCACSFYKSGFVRSRGYANHPPAADFRHLTKQESEATGCGLNQAPVAGFDGIGKMSEGVGEEALIHSRRRLLERDSFGNPNQPYCGDDRVACVGLSDETDSISRRDVGDFGTEGLDDSDALTAESCGKIGFACFAIERLSHQFAATLLYIEKVHASGMHANQHLSRLRNRQGSFFQLHNFRAAISMNANSSHRRGRHFAGGVLRVYFLHSIVLDAENRLLLLVPRA